MPQTVFFSWQADTEASVGRTFVERTLEQAVQAVSRDTTIEPAVREGLEVDRDTKNVGGQPPIVETIFQKIDRAAVFVPDLTFVGTRLDGRPTSNPNVLIEYGWALKSLTTARIVPVMNVTFGHPTDESMPFDMRHLRRPITYECSVDMNGAASECVRGQLAEELERNIRLVLQQTDARAELIRVLATARSLAAGKFQINRATHDRRTIEQAQRIYDDFVSAGWVSATLGPNKVFYPGVVGVMISGKTVDKYPDLLEPIQRAFLCLGIGVDIDPTKNSFTLDKEVVEIFVAHIR